MYYIEPKSVTSPKDKIDNLKVLRDGGATDWSMAEMEWDGRPVLALRWNGESEDPNTPGIGTPQSYGKPTWFVLPDEIRDIIVKAIGIDLQIK